MFLRAICLSAILLFPFLDAKADQTPRSRIEATVKVVRDLVRANKGNVDSVELDEKLQREAMPLFDFVEMSRRSLGANWSKGTVPQQKEFVQVFSDLLTRTYTKRIKASVADSKIDVVEESVQGDKALVRTIAVVDGEDVKIDYRFRFKKNEWRVYDVIIENIGLVSNYRNEFAGIMRKEGFSGLIVKLKEKWELPVEESK